MITGIAKKAIGVAVLLLLSVTLNAQLIAKFSANNTSGCASLIVSFTSTSLGNPTSWKWNLGNGTTSFEQNPSAIYFNAGEYTISLIVGKGNTYDTLTQLKYIKVFSQPVVNFNVNSTKGCYPLAIQFTDKSALAGGAIKVWEWDFGDGFTSKLQNPVHTYTASGNYNITLRVTGDNTCKNTLSKLKLINISPGVKAAFTNSSPTSCSAPVLIKFTNLTNGTGLVNQWQFGDGKTADQTNPSHMYTVTGNYSVKLIVTNSDGCTDTIIKPNLITAGTAKAGFISQDSICTDQNFLITNTSQPIPITNTWTFGDGSSGTAANPFIKYTKAGIYKIKLVANLGGCYDSITKNIIVKPKPLADFSAAVTTSCRAPFTVNFKNNSTNDISWNWDFGDNTYSNQQSPAHIYTSFGNFTVKLVVTNAMGCMDSILKQNFISVQQPIINLINLPDSGCIPFTKKFNITTQSADPITSYSWNLGDGSTSTLRSPEYTYTKTGSYSVTLTVKTLSGCINTSTMAKAVTTDIKPVANFSATPRNTCAQTHILFTDSSTENPTGWIWQFGDGTISYLKNPEHTYSDSGYFTVSLIVNNSGCSDTMEYKKFIYINPPIAQFSINSDCKKQFDRAFIDQSAGADKWNWDFGDGAVSNQQSPVHTYASTGTYQVALNVVNSLSGCSYTTTKSLDIVNAPINFILASPTSCKGNNIVFTTTFNIKDVTALDWNFGDGILQNSDTNNSNHIYLTSGNFMPSLVITDRLGCKDSLIKPIRIDGPTAKFALSVPGSCLNSTINFIDQSVNDSKHPIQDYYWNYGDGSSGHSKAGPFSHYFQTSGNFMVSLKVIDITGCSDSFTVSPGLFISTPVANFNSADTLSCPLENINFINISTGPELTYNWQFGNNSTSSLQNPITTFKKDGYYDIGLKITDQYGCRDSINRLKYIKIISPKARFTMSDSIANCPPLMVQFSNFSINAVTTHWDFGDGNVSEIQSPSHFYVYPGTYLIRLTISGRGGCMDTLQKFIKIGGPVGEIIYTPLIGCKPFKVDFTAFTTGAVSVIWDFSDGNILETKDSLVNHIYRSAGNYLPKLILVDNQGCHVPIRGKDTILVNGIIPYFTFLDKILCDTEYISYFDASFSNDLITGYKWNFDDGKFSTAQDAVHSYLKNGFYQPQITVYTQSGCIDSFKTITPVKVVAAPKINIQKSPDGCTPLNIYFKGIITVPDTAALIWKWTFPNNQFSELQNPLVQTYTAAALSNILLVATNSSGCTDSVATTVEAFQVPTVSAGKDSFICKNRGIYLQGTGAFSYTWTPSKGLSCTSCSAPFARPDSIIMYTVTGTSIQGCSAKDSIKILVEYPFKIAVSKTDTLCVGKSKKIFVVGGKFFDWTPSASLSNSNFSTLLVHPDTSTLYKVIVQDEKKCFVDTGFIFIKVYPIPTVFAGANKSINIGQTYSITPTISADVTSVEWLPLTGIQSSTYPGITIKPSTNIDYTVTVKNPGGCRTESSISIFVICNGANVFLPNTFSPNGDGVNDIFYARGTGLLKIKNLSIYNRWGQLVFEKKNFNANDAGAGWNGTFKGARLNPDVFDYTIDIICENNSVLTYKGNIALIL